MSVPVNAAKIGSALDAKRIEAGFQAALRENQRLRDENQRLKDRLAEYSIPLPCVPAPTEGRKACLPEPAAVEKVDAPADKAAKVVLFRSLFRGREDVYAIRWRMKDGKWGYRPDDKKDWDAVLASRPEDRKKVDQQTRVLYPLTDVIRQHLEGKKTVGVYPLLTDETCWFLAADFDKSTWQENALEFVETCRRLGVPAYLERSRSGNGGHVWVFLEHAAPAVLARKMGCAILTQTMERRHHLGLNSYDRFFPNQDTMPQGGFGNLIALPLQWTPRQNGNSLFVDDQMQPYPNQWQLLASVRRIAADQLDWIVNDAARRGQVLGVRASVAEGFEEEEPWTLPPSRTRVESIPEGACPESVELVLGNSVYVPKAGLPEAMLNQVIRLAAFQNPEFYKTQAMRLSTWDKPRIISCAEEFAHHIALPRGCLQEVSELLQAHGVHVSVRDERFAGTRIEVSFQGTLRDEQAAAVHKTLQHDDGVLCAPTAFGKTVVASKLIAERGVNTLVLVHRRQLLDQWRERLAVFLNLPPKAIGHVASGKAATTGIVDVALLQSVQR